MLDTAPNYGMGKSERRIGEALHNYDSFDRHWELKNGELIASQPIIVTNVEMKDHKTVVILPFLRKVFCLATRIR